ncbi:MAG: N-glycosylase/DNA lyase [Thermoplasmata archaeon]|nr:N-glycosylase/DNA lyase [Thermoplasmata archaeon]
MRVEELKERYREMKDVIEKRLEEFDSLWKEGSEEEVFAELVFCLLTPQSRAKLCWCAVEHLIEKGLLLNGGERDIEDVLKGVRFRKNKARYIVEARKLFTRKGQLELKKFLSSFGDVKTLREWLVRNVKGMGYKEASHFLRNIGLGKDMAILDRHILKNLKAFGVINDIPRALSRKKYLEIEEKMRKFSHEIRIPMSHLDLLFWSRQTGEIFK